MPTATDNSHLSVGAFAVNVAYGTQQRCTMSEPDALQAARALSASLAPALLALRHAQRQGLERLLNATVD